MALIQGPLVSCRVAELFVDLRRKEGKRMTSENCASCGSGDSLQISTVYLALKHYYKNTSAHGTGETTFHTWLATDITPESIYLCPACIASKSAAQMQRQRRSLRQWGAVLASAVLLWIPWVWTFSMDSLHIWSGPFLLAGSCLTYWNLIKKYLKLRVDLASGKPAIAAKEVCFQVCNQDYDVLLEKAKRQQKEEQGEHYTTIVEVACLTPCELEEKRKQDQLQR